MKRVIYFIVALCALCSTIANAALLNINPATVEAEAWTILDPQSGQVVAEHNSHVQRAPASLTKMMVAYVALKEIQAGRLNKNEVLTATPVVNMVQWDESQMYLKQGEQITVDHLLAGLIVMSANDAAVTLAEKIAGGVPQFVERMNKEAKALGMSQTRYRDPTGLSEGNVSTANDLVKLLRASQQYPLKMAAMGVAASSRLAASALCSQAVPSAPALWRSACHSAVQPLSCSGSTTWQGLPLASAATTWCTRPRVLAGSAQTAPRGSRR